MNRFVRNALRLPLRTIASIQRRMQPSYAIQQKAEGYAKKHVDAELQRQLNEVPGNSSDRQGRLLFYLAATTPAQGCLLEIGAFKGKSTAWLTQAARQSKRRLVSIDPHMGDSYETFKQTVARFKIEEVATLHHALSHEIGQSWDQPIAFLWIDGGHDYETVKQDIIDFTPHVQPGGTVVLDDYEAAFYPGLIRAVEETLHQDPAFENLGTIKNFALFRRKANAS